jgi:hypothetical protein
MVKKAGSLVNWLVNWLISKIPKTYNCNKKSLKIFIFLKKSAFFIAQVMKIPSAYVVTTLLRKQRSSRCSKNSRFMSFYERNFFRIE